MRTGQLVYVDDPALVLAPLAGKGSIDELARPRRRVPTISLRVFIEIEGKNKVPKEITDSSLEFVLTAHTALFGGEPTTSDPLQTPIRFGHGEGVRLVRPPKANSLGCLPHSQTYSGEALVVLRGECTFLQKLIYAKEAGASGVIAISDDDSPIHPSADASELEEIGDSVDDVAVVVVGKKDGDVLTKVLDIVEQYGLHRVMMAIVPKDPPTKQSVDKPRAPEKDIKDADTDKDSGGVRNYKLLYLNGHPLVNTRLLV